MTSILIRSALAIMLTPFLLTGLTLAQDLSAPSGQAAGEMIYVKVAGNREINGAAVGLDDIKFTTSFGDVSIPLGKVDGIKMKADANGAAVIAFKNGDLVTGKVTLDTINVKTEWGQAHINTASIETITSNENGRFYSDNTGGSSSWRFSKTPPVPAGRAPQRSN